MVADSRVNKSYREYGGNEKGRHEQNKNGGREARE